MSALGAGLGGEGTAEGLALAHCGRGLDGDALGVAAAIGGVIFAVLHLAADKSAACVLFHVVSILSLYIAIYFFAFAGLLFILRFFGDL